MKKLSKDFVILFATLLSITFLSSCNDKNNNLSANTVAYNSSSEESVQCPYKTTMVTGGYTNETENDRIKDSKEVSHIYNLMRPKKWEKLSKAPSKGKNAIKMYFDDTDTERYVYEVYNNGYMFYSHDLKSADKKTLPDGHTYQGEYQYYKVDDCVYNDLEDYFNAKYTVDP